MVEFLEVSVPRFAFGEHATFGFEDGSSRVRLAFSLPPLSLPPLPSLLSLLSLAWLLLVVPGLDD